MFFLKILLLSHFFIASLCADEVPVRTFFQRTNLNICNDSLDVLKEVSENLELKIEGRCKQDDASSRIFIKVDVFGEPEKKVSSMRIAPFCRRMNQNLSIIENFLKFIGFENVKTNRQMSSAGPPCFTPSNRLKFFMQAFDINF